MELIILMATSDKKRGGSSFKRPDSISRVTKIITVITTCFISRFIGHVRKYHDVHVLDTFAHAPQRKLNERKRLHYTQAKIKKWDIIHLMLLFATNFCLHT